MDEHAQFVSTETGCAQYEVFLALSISPLGILLRNLAVPWVFLGRRFAQNGSGLGLKFCLDFFLIVVPVLLSMSLFANSLLFLCLILVLCIATLLLFVMGEFYLLGKHRPPIKGLWHKIVEEHHHPTTFLTFLRSMVLIFTGIAILAVDFRVFPRKYAKTATYGHSLMDVGVAAFVYLSAVAPHLKTASMRERGEGRGGSRFSRVFFSSTAILVYLGLGRAIILELLSYPQHVSEYGVHWNFFFTFFFVRVVSRILPKRFHVLTGIFFAVVQQTMLTSGYQEWAVSDTAPRDSLISANREGLCSLMGYLTLFYFASAVGKFVTGTGCRVRNWMHCALHLLMVAIFFFMLQKACEMGLGPPSRRVVNLPYIFSMLCVLTYSMAVCLLVQMVALVGWAANMPHFGSEDNPWEGVQPCLLDAVNRAGIGFFLLGNVLTGLINMTMSTRDADDVTATAILMAYMLTCCGVASWLVARHKNKRN